MKKRKPTILSIDFLKELSSDILLQLNEIRQNDNMVDAVKGVSEEMIVREQRHILLLPSGDNALSIKHSYAKGRISGLETLVELIENAGEELERREQAHG